MRLETFNTSRYLLEFELDERVGIIRIRDVYSGVEFADAEYRYWACIECDGRITELEGLCDPHIDEEFPDRGGKIVSIEGRLGAENGGHRVRVRHRFYVPEDEEFLEEQIILQNAGQADVHLRDWRFGFRKLLEKPAHQGGPGTDIENYRLIAVPLRVQPDGKKHDYFLDDLHHGRYQCSVPQASGCLLGGPADAGRGRSEGWAWTDGENGVLIAKYNRKMIEYSMVETERLDGRAYLNFAGASTCLYGEPKEARLLAAGKEIGFGHTLLQFYEGRWRRGSYLFREYMSGLGHGLPDEYDPPIYWVVGMDSSDAPCTAEDIKQSARIASEIGCDGVELHCGWETTHGSSVWDIDRLGEISDAVGTIKDEYGLKFGLRITGRSCGDEFAGMYRIDAEGRIGYHLAHGDKPYWEPCVCSAAYQEEKLKRVLDIATLRVSQPGDDDGISRLQSRNSLDFISLDDFDWRGPCHDPNHGHPVPTTPDMHARAVVELIRKLHEKLPNALIEANDPVSPRGARYLPVYYLHDLRGSFDEISAYGCVRDPLGEVLSGRAMSLFYYDLAYDLPLHVAVNGGADNENCLAFWWYASTVRHLGIGGMENEPALRGAYRAAIAEYKSIKDLYTQGQFRALDEITHVHVLAEQGRCVVNAFNLTDAPMSREAEVRLNDLGLLDELTVTGAPYEVSGGKMLLKLELPPFSPLVVKMNPV